MKLRFTLNSLLTQSLLMIICLHLANAAQAGVCEKAATEYTEALANLQKELNWTAQLSNTTTKLKAAKDVVASAAKAANPETFKNFEGKIEAIKKAIDEDSGNMTSWLSIIATHQGTAFSRSKTFQDNKCGCNLYDGSALKASPSKVTLNDKNCIKFCDETIKSDKNRTTAYTCQFGPDTLKNYPAPTPSPSRSAKK